MADNAWQWLRTHQPESYEQLLEKLTQARDWYVGKATGHRRNSGDKELSNLLHIFKWYRDHGITLAELGTKGRMDKYREAQPMMHGIIEDTGLSDEEKAQKLWDATRDLKRDRTRIDARRRLMIPRKKSEA